VCTAFIGGFSAVFHTTFRETVIGELSGTIAKDYISEIIRFHRIQASPGFHDAIYYVKEVVDQFPGIRTEVEVYPADGKTRTWQWTAPLGWRVADGELHLVSPKQELLARFAETPVSIVAHSQSADVVAPLVYIEDGSSEKDYRRIDVKGKIVLTSGRAQEVQQEAVYKRGALGTIHFPPLERRTKHPNLILYQGIWPTAEEKDKVGFAFAVSGQVGSRLRRLIETEPEVLVHAKVDAELYNGKQRVLTAVIEGTEFLREEIALIAHLCHPRPGANDNASGSALLMELARVITTLIKEGKLPIPLRTIRFIWVPEFFGTIAFLYAHPELAPRTISAINCDMVGADPTIVGGSLNLHRTPDSLPSFINDLLEYHLSDAAKEPRLISPNGSNLPFRYEIKKFDWRSDHTIFIDPTFSVPCPMLNHWPDAFYHSNLDNLDKIDTTQLQRVGYAVLMTVLTQAYAESDDAMFLATQVHANAHTRITQMTQHYIHEAIQAIARTERGASLARILRKAMESIRQITRRESVALQSVKVLSPHDSELHNFIDSLLEDLTQERQEEVRKLRQVEDLLSRSIGYSPLKRLVLRKGERKARNLYPRRKFQGPIYFSEILRQTKVEDTEWLRTQQKDQPFFVEVLLELTNFMDGHRSLYEILTALEAQFGEVADIDTITRFTKLLKELDLIEIEKIKST
jgi:aminopeptidase-like protein